MAQECLIAIPNNTLQRQVAATDAEIERLIYEFYGLTDAKITSVERA